MSLRTRIAVLVGVTVLLASAIGGLGTGISSSSVGRNRLDRELVNDAGRLPVGGPRLAAQIQLILDTRSSTCDTALGDESSLDNGAGQSPQTQGRGGQNRAVDRLGRRDQFLRDYAGAIQLVRPGGTAVSACETIPVSDSDLAIAAAGKGQSFRTVVVDGERFRILTQGIGDLGAIQYARSLAIAEDTLRGLIQRIVGFGLIGALLASALGWWFAKRTTEPVRTLSATADRIAQTQDLGERIDVERSDEIGALAASFNTMLESLDVSRGQQQRLVQDASHELRTPLTSMRTNVELLQRHQDIEPDVRAQVLADINAELTELTELTSELVVSATEIPTQPDTSTPIELVDIAGLCVERATRRYRRAITLESTVESDDPVVCGDAMLIQRAVTNLINNAIKFSPDDSEVAVSAGPTAIVVRDRGPGIESQDLPHIFGRFFRATAARSAPGSGLGLSIVKQIIDAHGGTIDAANRTGGGLEIGFTLPATATAAGR